jgi:2-polyprenyl-3-methyl-5-hydroxy-6-metoxy-1,4-benzoquinol methylase
MNIPVNVVLEDAPCPLGCTRNDEIVLTGHDRIHNLPGEFDVVRCRTCGLMRTTPRPTPQTIGYYYPDDYGPYLGTRIRQAEHVSILSKFLTPIIKRVINFNTQRLPSLAPGRMLEIGCASGGFLHQMARKGWQVQGIEFSEKAAVAAAKQGYRVHSGPLETAHPPDATFDLIVGWMVLEHLHDPIGGLQKLRQWSKPGAWLVISVPNAKSLEFRLFKEKWYALQLPNHLHHFTPETIKRVLEAGGWTLVKIHHQRVLSNLIASTGYVLQEKGYAKLGQKLIDFPEQAGRWPYALYPLAWLFGLFGQTGRMTVWARARA